MKRRLLLFCLVVLLASGCAATTISTSGAGDGQTAAENLSYFPSGVTDIEIPKELEPVHDDSMFIETASYHGGILAFEGRVEISSLADYFVAVMKKNGWRQAGAVRYKNILLAFVKSGKSCIITIQDRGATRKTRVAIYLTEEVQPGSGVLVQ